MQAPARLYFVHDPMCSWCWAFRPTMARLAAQLPPRATLVRLLGGLAADSEEPMPAELRSYLQETWRRIQVRVPGTRFNFEFWNRCTPRRSTWPACRAVIAARRLDPAAEDRVIAAIQQAYYLEARNPSERTVLAELAKETGLDPQAFGALLEDPATAAALQSEIARGRAMGADSFPSLRLELGQATYPIDIDYNDSAPMLRAIEALLRGR
jgi:putative protein-disulfide isomerase